MCLLIKIRGNPLISMSNWRNRNKLPRAVLKHVKPELSREQDPDHDR